MTNFSPPDIIKAFELYCGCKGDPLHFIKLMHLEFEVMDSRVNLIWRVFDTLHKEGALK